MFHSPGIFLQNHRSHLPTERNARTVGEVLSKLQLELCDENKRTFDSESFPIHYYLFEDLEKKKLTNLKKQHKLDGCNNHSYQNVEGFFN
jgi:hypothetical protein